MTRAMYMAVVFLMASAVVQANQCSGGSECQSDINPSNVASVLETKPQMGALNDGGEDNPCSSGGECPSDDSSKHVVSMFQTKLRMHMGEVGGEAAASESYHSTEGLVGKMTGQLGNLMLKGNPNAILAELEQQVSSGVAPPFNVVSKIKRLVVEEILPDLEVAKDAAVQDTAGWLSAVGRCNNDFKSSEAYPGSTFHQAVNTSRIAHSNCRHDLQSMNTSYCVKLDKLLNDTCPSTTKPVPDTSTRATAVQYAKDLLHAIVQSGDNCTDQEQKLADKKVECAADQTSFESSFCYWKIELESDCKSLDRCYSESLGDYNDHAAKMKILWEKWDVETATLQKILCYCNLWLDEEDERDGRAQTNATNFQVCNKITHTPSPAISEPPAKVDCLLTSVAHHPGEQSFITREYGSSIDFVAPLVPCMEAPTIVPSTVAPTTTQAPTTQVPTTETPTTEAPTTEAPTTEAVSVALSTNVALPDGQTTHMYSSGQRLADHGVDYVKQCGNSNSDPYMVQYNSHGDTVNLADYITSGSVDGPFGVDVHGRNFKMAFQGEAGSSGKGFGCHANWLITFDLNVMRSKYFSGEPGAFKYTGRFGISANAGQPDQRGQGVVLVDGVVQAETEKVRRGDGGRDLEATIDASAQYLTIAMLNGDSSTSHDDQVWLDPTLTLLKDPSMAPTVAPTTQPIQVTPAPTPASLPTSNLLPDGCAQFAQNYQGVQAVGFTNKPALRPDNNPCTFSAPGQKTGVLAIPLQEGTDFSSVTCVVRKVPNEFFMTLVDGARTLLHPDKGWYYIVDDEAFIYALKFSWTGQLWARAGDGRDRELYPERLYVRASSSKDTFLSMKLEGGQIKWLYKSGTGSWEVLLSQDVPASASGKKYYVAFNSVYGIEGALCTQS